MAEAIDTLKIADDLEASGLERQQAKEIAQAVRHGRGDLVTKSDLDAGLAGFESRMTQQLAEHATEAAKRETCPLLALIGAIGIAVAILGTLIALT